MQLMYDSISHDWVVFIKGDILINTLRITPSSEQRHYGAKLSIEKTSVWYTPYSVKVAE